MKMIHLPVYNQAGKQQAVVMYQANRRVGTAATRSRGMVEGSTRKLYRQKGTGNARMGTIRTCIRRGGGVAFAKRARDFSQDMPKKMRRLARDSAILAKAEANQALVVEELKFARPKTKEMAALLRSLDADRGCLIALSEPNEWVYLSARNIPNTDVRLVEQLNAYEILRRRKLILTRQAFERMVAAKRPA